MNALTNALRSAAAVYSLPVLLLKAFAAVEGASTTHTDGIFQVIASTRADIIPRMPRANKALALGLSADAAPPDSALNTAFAQAFAQGNLLAQALCGAHYVSMQLQFFDGIVALAGLGYNAGAGTAQRVIAAFGGNAQATALHYQRRIGRSPGDASVGAGSSHVDPAIGTWLDFSVTANDSGRAIPHYIYLRQVPGRNFGLLDFIFKPPNLAGFGLFEGETAPIADDGQTVLRVVNGAFESSTITQPMTPTLFSQIDPRWSGARLGLPNAEPDSTIGRYGCTLTCLTMLANRAGRVLTPDALNAALAALGDGVGFGGATHNLMIFTGLPAVFPEIKYRDRIWQGGIAAGLARIDAALTSGLTVLVQLDSAPNLDGLQEHWVLLHAKQGDDYVIHDPMIHPPAPGSLLARYGGGTRSAAQIITHAVFYDYPLGALTAPSALRVTPTSDPDIAVVGGVPLRGLAKPDVEIVGRLPVNSVAVVTSLPGDGANAIGQAGSWLELDYSGKRGFAAAWLLRASPEVTRTFKPTKRSGRAELQPAWKPLIQAVRARAVTTLRAHPRSGKILARITANEALAVLEAPRTAKRKIGTRGTWLRVRDAQGREGYVSGGSVHVITPKPLG